MFNKTKNAIIVFFLASLLSCGGGKSINNNADQRSGDEIAFLGEIAANETALRAVLADIDQRGIKKIYCLGGVVGYGAKPNECIEILGARHIPTVRSFFEDCINGFVSTEIVYEHTMKSLVWTKSTLTQENKAWIDALPYTIKVGSALLCNSDFHSPKDHEYLQNTATVGRSFRALTSQGHSIGFVAHSHVAASFFDGNPITYSLDSDIEYSDRTVAIFNVGSVGQPRDENPNACYAIWSAGNRKVQWIRVRYDFQATQREILAAGLPDHLASRLETGK